MFSRNIQPLENIVHWKATEYRTFLVYLGSIVLKDNLDSKKYNHFMLLNISISILLSSQLTSNYAHIARVLCKNFVDDAFILYGQSCITYNMHNIIHITDDAIRFGNLDI